MDAQELFGTKIPAAIAKFPDKAKEINAIYYFNITGDGGGEWTVNLSPTGPSVSTGNQGNSQCQITIGHEDFKTLLKNPQAGMQLYFQGKLKVGGDPTLAMKLQKLFQLDV